MSVYIIFCHFSIFIFCSHFYTRLKRRWPKRSTSEWIEVLMIRKISQRNICRIFMMKSKKVKSKSKLPGGRNLIIQQYRVSSCVCLTGEFLGISVSEYGIPSGITPLGYSDIRLQYSSTLCCVAISKERRLIVMSLWFIQAFIDEPLLTTSNKETFL